MAAEVIELRGDDAQALLSYVNGAIKVAGELHAALIQCVGSVHDASAKGHAACKVVLHFSEHLFIAMRA